MRLGRLMPIGSACSFVYHERREGIFTVRLRQLGHPTELRGALWSAAGCVPLTNRVDGGAWSFTIGQNAQASLPATVNAYPVTQLLEMAGRNQIDILKLDIEGSERERFSKNTDWLDHVSVIIIELHDRFQPGCAKAVYQKLVECRSHQEVRGENILIGTEQQTICRIRVAG